MVIYKKMSKKINNLYILTFYRTRFLHWEVNYLLTG